MMLMRAQEQNHIWTLFQLRKISNLAICRKRRTKPIRKEELFFFFKAEVDINYFFLSNISQAQLSQKPLIIPTSPQICWCCQVGKVIQADNINDWTHHSGIILKGTEKGGKKSSQVFLKGLEKLPEIIKTAAHVACKFLFGFSSTVLTAEQWLMYTMFKWRRLDISQVYTMDKENEARDPHT